MDVTTLHIAVWLATWVGTGFVYVLMIRRGINYVSRPGWVALYFTAATGLAAWPVREQLLPSLQALRPWHALLVGGATAVHVVGILALRAYVGPSELARRHPHIYWLRLDRRYLISKPFEILFQQALVLVLMLLLTERGFSVLACIACFVVLFPALHVPIVPLVGPTFGWYYVTASGVAAVVFPILIAARPDGYVFTYVLHGLFYFASAAVITLFARGRAQTRSTVSRR
jgi:hypothetical protein